MGLVFTFVQRAAEPKEDPRRVRAVEEEEQQTGETAVREVPERVYLRAVMDRMMEMPEAFAAAVEAMRRVRERFLADGSLPEVT